MRRKKTIILTVTGLLLASMGLIWYIFGREYQNLTLTYTSINNAQVYIASNDTPEKKHIVKSGEGKYLKKGLYTVTVDGGTDIQKRNTLVELSDTPAQVQIPVTLTRKKLTDISLSEGAAIKAAVLNSVDGIDGSYSIDSIEAQKDGTWAVVRLKSIQEHSNSDDLVMISQKNNENWKIIAPPAITISSAEYPEIPFEVVRATLPNN